MNGFIYITKFLKALGITTILFLVVTFLATIFNYFNLIGLGTMGILQTIIPILSLLVGGIYLGKLAKNKGWLEGVKLSSFFIVFMLLFHLIGANENFGFKTILYYGILLISGMVGSMVGINLKRKN